MTTDLDIVEQRFATLTAEITSNVLKITKESADEVPKLLTKIDHSFDEAKLTLEQIEQEIRTIPNTERPGHQSHLTGFQKEFKKLRNDYAQAKTRMLHADTDLVRIQLFEPDLDGDRTALISDTVGVNSRASFDDVEQVASKQRAASTTRRDHLPYRSSKGSSSGFDFNRGTRIATLVLRRIKQSKLVVYSLSIIVMLVLMVVIFRRLF